MKYIIPLLVLLIGSGFALNYSAPISTATNTYCYDNATLYLEYIEVVNTANSNNTYNTSGFINCAYGCSINRCNASPLDTYLYLAGGLLILLVVLILLKTLL
jgi:hypothetical protein